MSAKELLERAGKRMDATLADARTKLATVRTGRASLAILDGVTIDYYGTPTPLNQVAKLSIPEPTLIVAHPFDPSTLSAIDHRHRLPAALHAPGSRGQDLPAAGLYRGTGHAGVAALCHHHGAGALIPADAPAEEKEQ